MRVLVTGAHGQLGHDVVDVFSRENEVFGFGHNELDITDANHTYSLISELRPDVIIHAAAYTAVDRAEHEPGAAFAVNVTGTHNVALAAQSVGAKLCYISTDYVFDGTAVCPYIESAPANPQNVYGRTKLEGEKEVQACCTNLFIVRTSWVFGLYGDNFVKKILHLAAVGQPLHVVDDQVGSPTYTKDLAVFLNLLLQTNEFGIYHASNSDACTWYEFAKAILLQAGLNARLLPCTTGELLFSAVRPAYSVLSHKAMRDHGFPLLRSWRGALSAFLAELSANRSEIL